MGTTNRAFYSGLIGAMVRGFRNIFSGKSWTYTAEPSDPYKKKTRVIEPGRRTFKYLGVDGAIHSVRIGNAFPVRPTHQARFFIATNENRTLLEVS